MYAARGVGQAFTEGWIFKEKANNREGEDAVQGHTRRARGVMEDIRS